MFINLFQLYSMTGENVAVALFCIGNVDIIFNVVMWNICRVCIILSDLEKTDIALLKQESINAYPNKISVTRT